MQKRGWHHFNIEKLFIRIKIRFFFLYLFYWSAIFKFYFLEDGLMVCIKPKNWHSYYLVFFHCLASMSRDSATKNMQIWILLPFTVCIFFIIFGNRSPTGSSPGGVLRPACPALWWGHPGVQGANQQVRTALLSPPPPVSPPTLCCCCGPTSF